MKKNIELRIQDWLTRDKASFNTLGWNSLLEGSVVVGSDLGAIREENQDRVIFAQIKVKNKVSYLGILSDGMGGMEGGTECAALAISSFLVECYASFHLPLKKRISLAIKKANISVYQQYLGRGGATLSAFIVESDKIIFANVGDSRIYLLNDDHFYQLSHDDTLAARLKRTDTLNSPLLQYIGLGDGLEAHIFTDEIISANHQIILTSDGLHHLEKRQLNSLLNQEEQSLSEQCRRVLLASNWLDGSDNSSILIAKNIDINASNIKFDGMYLMSSHGNLELDGETLLNYYNDDSLNDFNLRSSAIKNNKLEEDEPLGTKKKLAGKDNFSNKEKKQVKDNVLQLRISYDE